jgi:hypothetical protein
MTVKFSEVQRSDVPSAPYDYGNHWFREKGDGWQRLVIGPSDGHIGLIEQLCRPLPGPFGILYVLLVPRCDHEAGRYQNATPASRKELLSFLHQYRDYFEHDGRHNVWVMCVQSEAQLVYDNHNVIYAYGPLDSFESTLRNHGFVENSVVVPVPHSHEYHAEFDHVENQIIDHWQWKLFPLRDQDDP